MPMSERSKKVYGGEIATDDQIQRRGLETIMPGVAILTTCGLCREDVASLVHDFVMECPLWEQSLENHENAASVLLMELVGQMVVSMITVAEDVTPDGKPRVGDL